MKMTLKYTTAKIIVAFAIVLALLAGSIALRSVYSKTAIDSFESCVAAGYPVMESYPAQCIANGQTFIEDISKE